MDTAGDLNRGGRRRFFRAFALASASAKKERENAKKKRGEKAKAPSAKEEKREFSLFPPSHTGSPVLEPKDAGRGEKEGSLVKCVQYIVLNIIITFHSVFIMEPVGKRQMGETWKEKHTRNGEKETEINGQRGRDRDKWTEGKRQRREKEGKRQRGRGRDKWTEGKRQRREKEGKRQRGRDRDKWTEGKRQR
jgi:hypothetical protein